MISFHIRSMWETICDAQAGFCTLTSTSKFVSKFSREPLSGIADQRAPPPPWKLKFGQILALWVFLVLTPEYPLSPKIEI